MDVGKKNSLPVLETKFLLALWPKALNMRISLVCLLSIHIHTMLWRGHAVAHLVEALRYKPEGREFDFRWCH